MSASVKKRRRAFVRDAGFYKSIFIIALPIALQNMVTLAVSMADTLMLGKADSTGLLLSASSLANQPFSLMSTFCFGLSGGTSVLCTQYFGKGDKDSIRTVFAMVLRGAVYMSAVFAGTVLIFPEWVMSLFTNAPDKIAAGAEYLSIIGWAYVFFGVSYTLQCMLRTVAKVNISVITSLVSLSFNIVGNYLLIFGKFGFPALGIKGAAIATFIARFIEFAVMFVYTFIIERDIGFKLKHLFAKNKTLFRDLVRYGAPVFANEAAWSLAMAVQASIIGHIDYTLGDPVAANAINDTLGQLSILGIWGVAGGAAVLVGASIGEGDIEKAKDRAYTFQYIAMIFGLIATALIFLVRDPILGLYDLEAETHKIAYDMIGATAIVQVFVAMTAVSIVGTLRSGGDTVFCFIIETLALWAISIPAAFVASAFLKLPAAIVILIMKFSEVVKAVICHIRVIGGKFIKSVTRTADEL